MGLFSKIAKEAGLLALGVVSPGAAVGVKYASDKRRAEDITSLRSELDTLLKATAEHLESDESSEFLTAVQNAAMRMISDDDSRKAILEEVGHSPEFFVSTVCEALLDNDTVKSIARSKRIDLEEVKCYMVTIPRAMFNTALECFKHMGIPDGKQFNLLRDIVASWLVMPDAMLSLFSASNSNLRIATSALMKKFIRSPEIMSVLSDAGITEAQYLQAIEKFKDK